MNKRQSQLKYEHSDKGKASNKTYYLKKKLLNMKEIEKI